MEIIQKSNADELVLTVAGRLDTTTAPELDAVVSEIPIEVKKLVMDFIKLEYISSAGLRVLLAAQKKMSKQGKMVLVNVNATVKEVFEITGFNDVLTFE